MDNYSNLYQGLRNSFYEGVKNTEKTTADGKPVIEVIISAPTKLVTTEEGDFSLTTGDGIVPDFKEPDDKDANQFMAMTFEEQKLIDIENEQKGIKKGLKGLTPTYETDMDRILKQKAVILQQELNEGKLVTETTSTGAPAPIVKLEEKNFSVNNDEFEDGIDDGVLNNEK